MNFLLSLSEDGTQLDIVFEETPVKHVFSIFSDEEYRTENDGRAEGNEFIIASANRIGTNHIVISLQQLAGQITCPTCKGLKKRIQKPQTRKIIDAFEFDDSAGTIEGLETFDKSVLLVDIIFQNTMYRCMNPTCNRLFKLSPAFLRADTKSPFSNRFASFIRDWHRDGCSIKEIVRWSKEHLSLDLSEATVYNMTNENASSVPYLLLENKKWTFQK